LQVLTGGGVMRSAGSDGSHDAPRWRVFISHTSELRDFPKGTSYVAAVERAISAAGHVIVDMADFPAANQPAAQVCAERVQGCEVYVGVLGTRYGSPVRDRPEMSYTELEFDTATEAGLDRLVFVLDTDADDVGIPVSKLIDREFGVRQDAFRLRVQDSGLLTPSFANPAELGRLVERSLQSIGLRRQAVASAAAAPDEYLKAILELCKVPVRDLASILPYIAGHVASAIVTVPSQYEGSRLKDHRLQFIRQDLQLAVVALRHRGDSEWLAGGAVSEAPLTLGAELLVCGPKLAIAKLRTRFIAT
jgi:Domain of unknown function (DUF4062)